MLKGRNDGTFALKGANAQTDSLITVWDGKRKTGYSPRKLEGAIILGCGGDGRGFYDTDISNESSLYRTDNAGLDTADGATVYGWVTEGDWLRYAVEVAGSEKMAVNARVASASDNASFSLLLDEKEIASFAVPNTSDWKTFKEVTNTLDGLSEEKLVLKLKVGKPYFNVDWIEFSPVSTEEIAMEQRLSVGQEHYQVFNLLGVKISTGNDLTALKRSLPVGVYLIKNMTSGKITKTGIAHKVK